MSDEKRDRLEFPPQTHATVTSILAHAQRREGQAHDEAASLRQTIDRQRAQLDDAAADARAYERRIGALAAELWQQTQRARAARRDTWLVLVVAGVSIVVLVVLALVAVGGW